MDKVFQLRMTENLFKQIDDFIKVEEKKTGLSMSMADFFRVAASEKLLRR